MGETGVSMRVTKGFFRRKFVPPQLPYAYVSEEKDTARIERLDTWELCLISSANGYGKTSLLAQWYEMFEQRDDCFPLWMSLDEHDRDPVHMLTAFALVFQQVDPGFYDYAVSIENEASDRGEEFIEEVAIGLVNLIDDACNPDTNYVVFLDNANRGDFNATDDWTSFLYRNSGHNIKYILSGTWISSKTRDLLFDSMAFELTTEDLMFDEKRMNAYAHKLIENLRKQDYEETRDYACGWPMAFVFYKLALERHGNTQSILKMLESSYSRFFESNVTDDIEAPYYEFMVETSFLEELDPDLCDAVVGTSQSRVIIETLYTRNCYVLYNRETGDYFYMPLFQKFLQSKLLAMRSRQISKLAQHAVEYCTVHERRDELAKYLILASDQFYLESVVSKGMDFEAPKTELGLCEYVLSQPLEAFKTDPYLMSVSAWSAISAGLVDMARGKFSEIASLTLETEQSAGYRYADALCTALEGESAASLKIIEGILEDKDLDFPHALECLLVHMEGECHERLGDIAGSRRSYQRAMSLAERESSSFYKMFDMYLLARQNVDLGLLDEAVALSYRAIVDCREGSSVYGEFNTIIAYVYIQRNELDEAERLLKRASSLVSPEANLDIYLDTQVAFARFKQMQGDYIGALEIISNLLRSIGNKRVPRNMIMEAYAVQAMLALATDDRATLLLCEPVVDAFKDDADLLRSIPCMQAMACVHIARGEDEEGIALFQRAKERSRECGSSYFVAQTSLYLAIAYAEMGKAEKAAIETNCALEAAMPQQYRALFLWGGSAAKDLLIKQATNRKTSSNIRRFAKELLAVFGSEKEVRSDIAWSQGDVSGYYSLTSREREILHCLNSGMSRREIALQLSVSENTVKTHLKNIYAKLGVHSRSEAYKAMLEAVELSDEP